MWHIQQGKRAAHQQHRNWIFSQTVDWNLCKVLTLLWYIGNLIAINDKWSALIFIENSPDLCKICFNWKNVLDVIT